MPRAPVAGALYCIIAVISIFLAAVASEVGFAAVPCLVFFAMPEFYIARRGVPATDKERPADLQRDEK